MMSRFYHENNNGPLEDPATRRELSLVRYQEEKTTR